MNELATTTHEVPTPEVKLFAEGTVIPAHPLALTPERKFDERCQRALTRYYIASGAGGLAVGVHTTQFAIHEPSVGLLEPVLALAAETVREARLGRPFICVAGAVGDVSQAVGEAELAASLGYQAVLLSPSGTASLSEDHLLERAQAVGEVLPVIGFYLQQAVGGRYLSRAFWRRFADLPSVIGIKIAPFDRYRSVDVLRAVAESERGEEVALYTGNDDAIVTDLLSPFVASLDGRTVTRRIVGGLLGQWAVWTQAAVNLHEQARLAYGGDDALLRSLLERSHQLTDANGAVFDAPNAFRGCIAGVNHVLHQQGLLSGAWCLDEEECLSPGQMEEIDRVRRMYPWIVDDDFVAEHLDEWLS